MNRVTKYTDFRGNTVKYGYDTLGNLISIEYAGGRIVGYLHYPTGRLKSVTDCNGKVTNYKYDNMGNLTKEIDPLDSVITYEYNKYGRMTSSTDAMPKRHEEYVNKKCSRYIKLGYHQASPKLMGVNGNGWF